MQVSLVAQSRSYSRLSRRLASNHANVRSTSQRRGSIWNPGSGRYWDQSIWSLGRLDGDPGALEVMDRAEHLDAPPDDGLDPVGALAAAVASRIQPEMLHPGQWSADQSEPKCGAGVV